MIPIEELKPRCAVIALAAVALLMIPIEELKHAFTICSVELLCKTFDDTY